MKKKKKKQIKEVVNSHCSESKKHEFSEKGILKYLLLLSVDCCCNSRMYQNKEIQNGWKGGEKKITHLSLIKLVIKSDKTKSRIERTMIHVLREISAINIQRNWTNEVAMK